MKVLVVYSSRTGNTRRVGEAVAAALSGARLVSVADMPEDVSGYDLVFLGFWAFRRGADMETRQKAALLRGNKVALYATAGAYPDSEPAMAYLANTAALLDESNTYLGGFICQGRVHSYHERRRGPHTEEVHPLTPEREARLEAAESHPDAADLARAAEFAKAMAEKAGAAV